MNHYYYCGYRLESELDLTPIALLIEPARPPDIKVHRISTPFGDDKQPLISSHPIWSWDGENFFWHLEGVARFCIAVDGCKIDVDIDYEPKSSAIFLLRVGLAIAALLRGDYLLNGAAVALDGEAVAFIGPSASGKSTAATSLVSQGWQLVADSLLRINQDAEGIYVVHPQACDTWLWPDSLQALGLPSNEFLRVRPPLALQAHPSTITNFEPVPLRRIGLLREQRGNDLELFEPKPHHGAQAFEWILHHLAANDVAEVLADRASLFAWAIGISQQAQCETLEVPWGWDNLPALSRALVLWALGQKWMGDQAPCT